MSSASDVNEIDIYLRTTDFVHATCCFLENGVYGQAESYTRSHAITLAVQIVMPTIVDLKQAD